MKDRKQSVWPNPSPVPPPAPFPVPIPPPPGPPPAPPASPVISEDWEVAFVEPWGFVWVTVDGYVARKLTKEEIEKCADWFEEDA